MGDWRDLGDPGTPGPLGDPVGVWLSGIGGGTGSWETGKTSGFGCLETAKIWGSGRLERSGGLAGMGGAPTHCVGGGMGDWRDLRI